MHFSELFLPLVLTLGSATMVATLFHYLKLPPVIGFLVTGIIIGPHGLAFVSSLPQVEILAEIGAILLMFTIGLDFSLKEILDLRRPLFGLGFVQVAGTIVLTAVGLHYFFDFPWDRAMVFGGLVALSSSALIFRFLHKFRDVESPHGQACVSVLLFQDLAVIPLLLGLPYLAGAEVFSLSTISLTSLGLFIAKIGAILLFIIGGARVLIPKLLELVVKTRSSELFFFSILFICSLTAYAMHGVGLSFSLGAFFAGIMISESDYGRQATTNFIPLRDNFMGLFFIAIGMLLIPGFVVDNLSYLLLFGGLVLGIKIVVLFFALWLTKNPTSLAISTALILFQVGEFSFILAEKAFHLDLLTNFDRQSFLTVSIGSLILTPLAYRYAPKVGQQSQKVGWFPGHLGAVATQLREKILPKALQINLKKGMSQDHRPENHSIIVGFGVAGRSVASALKGLDLPYVVIDINHETVRREKILGEPIFFGDAARAEILQQAGIGSAKLLILTSSGAHMTKSILDTAQELNPNLEILVRAFYMRELNGLRKNPRIRPIVAELESSLEILHQTLILYEITESKIQSFLSEARSSVFKT